MLAEAVQLLEVVAHDQRRLHEEATHADDVGADLVGLVQHVRDRHLDAEVVHLVAVVRENDVDEVLADVVNVALHGGNHDGALPGVALCSLHVRLETGDGCLHRLGRLQDERQLHLAGAEQVSDRLHAGKQHVVDDVERLVAGAERLVEFVLEPVPVAVDDAKLEASLDRPVRAILFHRGGGAAQPVEVGDQLGEGVVSVLGPTAVVDEIEAEVSLGLAHSVEGEDLGGMNDGAVEAGLDALVEEDRVEDLPSGRGEAERDVRQTEHGVHPRQSGLDPPDPFDRLDAVAAGLLHAGREGERERVEQEALRREAVAFHCQIVDRLGGAELPIGRAGLALLVDRRADDRCAVLVRERKESVEPSAGGIAVFEVYRVEDRSAADPLQGSLDDWWFGGVDDERNRRL